MNERSWSTFENKADWGEGPWLTEPDKIQWIDERSNLDCLIVRNRLGALCGYVGIPPGHPLHGCDYDKPDLDIHGGLTFADRCDEHAPEGTGICHIPLPGRPADVWWLGFDCAHVCDLVPGMNQWTSATESLGERDVYRTVAYVKGECAHLAAQLAT